MVALPDLVADRLQLLGSAVPHRRSVAILKGRGVPGSVGGRAGGQGRRRRERGGWPGKAGSKEHLLY
eukprot:495358-Rhodomonas_salina.1